ncbi:MAG TPA: ribosome small subunit-dependent GTPase A [Spirochaetia bacterium]|nr:ribosome small subunit-dependent GTPase A [Spirochaetia bacterium]
MPSLNLGTVLSGANNSFSVLAEDGSIHYCALKGKKLKGAEGFYNPLAAGDLVDWEPASAGTGMILSLRPRKSLFWRYNEKGKAVQAIAANMDLVVCVTSAGLPPFRPRFIDRVSLEPASEGIPLIIALNKSDLGVDDDIAERMADYRRIGFETMELSAGTGDGVEALRKRVAGLTSVFVGQSGVGKSSILNAIESGLGLKVGEVCEKYERGRHTTVAAILSTLSDGATRVIDTPGFRRLAVRGIDPATLGACFPEIRAASAGCALGSRCRHLDEPGCAVVAALETGGVHEDRYESYARILAELEDTRGYAKKAGRPRRRHEDDYEDA